ncbi:MAG: Gfo/Idh/MocA family oxidoreductase [Fimbriimonadaceae bacterium]|nr:Gfo/Idh/MocA family oxidoreductase [Fimbriimonadaceae bacterium]QYK57783.1 MAG: Gfo/Idh/MocA family oxidoreductase [Fimbriimonadaceae bacterium]
MQIGVVGAGAWGKNIVNTLAELGHLAGVAELSPDLRAKTAEAHPETPVVETFDQLASLGLEAVCIAAPAEHHAPLARQALAAGLHVFVEKPMTLSVADAEDLVARADQADRRLMVGHLLLYQPAVQFIKREIEAGRVGILYSLNHERLNLGRARKVENVLWSLGVHDVAVCLYLAGCGAYEVSIFGQDVLQPGIDDDTRLTVQLASGAVGHVHNSWLWPELRRRLTVIGSNGMLVYDEVAQTVTWHDKGINPDLTSRDAGSEVVYEGVGKPLALEMEHFIECCQTGRTPISDGRSGLEVVRVLERARPVR